MNEINDELLQNSFQKTFDDIETIKKTITMINEIDSNQQFKR